MSQRNDLTIDEAIRDPMIRLVMKADRVDPHALEALLRSLADKQYPGSKAPPSRFPGDAAPEHSRRLSRIAKAFGEAKALNEACVSW